MTATTPPAASPDPEPSPRKGPDPTPRTGSDPGPVAGPAPPDPRPAAHTEPAPKPLDPTGPKSVSPGDSPVVAKLLDDLHRLGIERRLSTPLRVTLRIIRMNSLRRYRVQRTVAVVGALLGVAVPLAIAVLLARQSAGGEWYTLYDEEADTAFNASAALLLVLLGGALLLLSRTITALNRQARQGREQAPVAAITRAIHACAQAHRARGRRQADQHKRLARHLAQVAAEVQRVHRARRSLPPSLPRYRHHRRRLKEHERTVVGALHAAEYRIHCEGDEALRDLAELLLTIAERYAAGRIGALLDESHLAGVQPVPDREVWRVATAVVLAMAGSLLVALVGLPNDAVGPVMVGVSVLAFVLVYGRDVRRVLDVLGVLHGP